MSRKTHTIPIDAPQAAIRALVPGLSVIELARRLGIARENVMKAERLTRDGASVAALSRLARACGFELRISVVPLEPADAAPAEKSA